MLTVVDLIISVYGHGGQFSPTLNGYDVPPALERCSNANHRDAPIDFDLKLFGNSSSGTTPDSKNSSRTKRRERIPSNSPSFLLFSSGQKKSSSPSIAVKRQAAFLEQQASPPLLGIKFQNCSYQAFDIISGGFHIHRQPILSHRFGSDRPDACGFHLLRPRELESHKILDRR